MITLFELSLRQAVGGRRVWVMLGLATIPVLLAAMLSAFADEATPLELSDAITNRLIISLVLPLVMLVLGTASFGNELEDRTLGFLALKPLPRWTIVAPKFAAPLIVGAALVVVSGVISSLLIMDGDIGHAGATALALTLGSIAYASAFTWAGLAIRHALAFGLGYVFVWEAFLTDFLGGIRFLSVREYTLATIHGIDDERLLDAGVQLTAGQAFAGVAVVAVLFLFLTVRRLGRMDVP